MEEIIKRINEVKENEVVRLGPKIFMWKEGSTFNVDVTNRQFDDLEDLLTGQKEKAFFLIDLSVAGRPGPEIIQLFEKRNKFFGDLFIHVAMYTGKNHLMHLGIKVYLIRFAWPSYSAHKNLKSALKSLS